MVCFVLFYKENWNIGLVIRCFIISFPILLKMTFFIKVRNSWSTIMFLVILPTPLQKPFSFPALWPSCWPVVKRRRGEGKGGFVFENPAIYKWLPLVWYMHLWVFIFRCLVSGSMSWRKELCHLSLILCTQPNHAPVLSPITSGISYASSLPGVHNSCQWFPVPVESSFRNMRQF